MVRQMYWGSGPSRAGTKQNNVQGSITTYVGIDSQLATSRTGEGPQVRMGSANDKNLSLRMGDMVFVSRRDFNFIPKGASTTNGLDISQYETDMELQRSFVSAGIAQSGFRYGSDSHSRVAVAVAGAHNVFYNGVKRAPFGTRLRAKFYSVLPEKRKKEVDARKNLKTPGEQVKDRLDVLLEPIEVSDPYPIIQVAIQQMLNPSTKIAELLKPLSSRGDQKRSAVEDVDSALAKFVVSAITSGITELRMRGKIYFRSELPADFVPVNGVDPLNPVAFNKDKLSRLAETSVINKQKFNFDKPGSGASVQAATSNVAEFDQARRARGRHLLAMHALLGDVNMGSSIKPSEPILKSIMHRIFQNSVPTVSSESLKHHDVRHDLGIEKEQTDRAAGSLQVTTIARSAAAQLKLFQANAVTGITAAYRQGIAGDVTDHVATSLEPLIPGTNAYLLLNKVAS